MMTRRFGPKVSTLLLSMLLLAACGQADSPAESDAHEHAHEHDSASEFERGPHRGRMLRQDAFALEVTLYETGVPPQFRLYAYQNNQPVPAETVQAAIVLERLGGISDRFQFRAEGDYLVGNATVVEPHSFDVSVTASHAGRSYQWQYASHEGRTSIPKATADAAGVTVARAGPATLHETASLMGQVALNADRYAAVRARFPGPVQEVYVNLGDTVRAGQPLARIENADTLGRYQIIAPLAGVILARHTNVGDVAGSEPLFEIADLSNLWLELHAFGAQAARLKPGMAVAVDDPSGQIQTTSIQRILPLAASASQSAVARALLPNADGQWRPGMAVHAAVTLTSREVPLAVALPALQRFRDFTVVFARFDDTYEVRMLELGERDRAHVEVLGGIAPGTDYVVEQSFLIKADIEKSGAGHDH